MVTQQVPLRTEKTPMAKRIFANPFSEFRHEMDDLFDKFFATRPAFDFRLPLSKDFTKSLTSEKGMIVPDIDIHESKDKFWLRAELPGLSAKDVDLTLQDGVLTLTGEKKVDWEKKEDNIHVMECRYGTFQRSFTLPIWVDPSKVSAKFTNGVLTVTMPKVAEKRSPQKQIKIN